MCHARPGELMYKVGWPVMRSYRCKGSRGERALGRSLDPCGCMPFSTDTIALLPWMGKEHEIRARSVQMFAQTTYCTMVGGLERNLGAGVTEHTTCFEWCRCIISSQPGLNLADRAQF